MAGPRSTRGSELEGRAQIDSLAVTTIVGQALQLIALRLVADPARDVEALRDGVGPANADRPAVIQPDRATVRAGRAFAGDLQFGGPALAGEDEPQIRRLTAGRQ